MKNGVEVIDVTPTGEWQVKARQLDVSGVWRTENVTTVRGVPIKISSLSVTDPFGPASATLQIPSVSPLEPIGDGSVDLWWLRDHTQISIEWSVTDGDLFRALKEIGQFTSYVWEGNLISFNTNSESATSLSVECLGAMRVLDHRLAKPGTLYRPIPFEAAIKRAFDTADSEHPTGLSSMSIQMPSHAPTFSIKKRRYKTKAGRVRYKNRDPKYLIPSSVSVGSHWSAMVTRETGNWGKVLSEYVQPMLSGMYTNRGRYTIRLDPGRRPVFFHKDHVFAVDDNELLVVNAVTPGVKFSLSEDHSQTLTTVYGEVTSTFSGTSYNGAKVDGTGNSVTYKPFAESPWVDSKNSQQRRSVARQEVHTQFTAGLAVRDAQSVAKQHLRTFSDAGLTGTVMFNRVDPLVRGKGGEMITFPRQLIKPGHTIRLDGYRGQTPGPLLYVSELSQNVEGDTVTATVDSKFRDFKSLREARIRGRDSLRPYHTTALLDKFSSNIPDPMLRWSYARGSGFFPKESKKLWARMESGGYDMEFPWTDMTTKYPPKRYGDRYCKIKGHKPGSRSKEIRPETFWNVPNTKKKFNRVGRMFLAQAGEIALFQIAAFDEDGNVLPVSFHVSIWGLPTVTAKHTPRIPKQNGKNGQPNTGDGNYHRNGRHYKYGHPYPFFINAWESVRQDGALIVTDSQQLSTVGGTMFAGWGNHSEKAGYWPGTSRSKRFESTGLLVDSTPWSFDMTADGSSKFSHDNRKKNSLRVNGTARVLIFCDDRPRQDVYFLGRAYMKRPGGA